MDAVAEDADPLLRPAVGDDVADVEVPADPLAVELVGVAGGFERAEQEVVPDVLHEQADLQILGHGQNLSDLLLRAFVGGVIRDTRVDHGRDDEHGRAAQSLAVPDGLLKAAPALGPHVRIRVRKRLGPVNRVDDARDDDAGLVHRAEQFVLVQLAGGVRLHAVEPEFFDKTELFEHGVARADHPVLQRLLDVPILWHGERLGCGRHGADSNRERGAGARCDEASSIEFAGHGDLRVRP